MPDPSQPAGAGRLSRLIVVPYIAARSDEVGGAESELTVRRDGRGLCYRQEEADDRDVCGALYGRVSISDGSGRPVFRDVHPRRQRECMEGLLCQVCARPASTTRGGTLFLARRREPEEMRAGWPEDSLTAQPPLCVPCARVSVERCHYLAGRHVAIRARKVRRYGVFGTPYTAGPYGTVRPLDDGGEGVTVPYGGPHVRWVLASQLVVELRRCTVVDLADE